MMCKFVFVIAVDIISAIEFDKTGDHLATGDRGGRVVLFERTDTKEVGFFCLLLEYLFTTKLIVLMIMSFVCTVFFSRLEVDES